MKKEKIVRQLETELEELFNRHPEKDTYIELFRKRCDAIYDVKIQKYQIGEKTFNELRDSIRSDEEKYIEESINLVLRR